MKPEPPQEVLDYIRDNRATYTREAIDAELREAGHDQAVIDAAWRAFPVERAAVQGPPPRVLAAVQFWLLLVAVACVAIVILPLISVFFLNLVASMTLSSDAIADNGVLFILAALAPILLGYLAIGIGGWLLRRRDQAAGLGVLSGLVVAFVVSVIILGTCVAIIAQL
jgi:hypothetical protein